MIVYDTPSAETCPPTCESVVGSAKKCFDELADFCQASKLPFWKFEKELAVRLAVLACQLIRLFLTARYHRLDVQPHLQNGKYRMSDKYAERTINTPHGDVTYGRQYLQARKGGKGIFPLDIDLGLTWDSLSPWMLQWVTKLATRMSFNSVRKVCQAAFGWAPATETIEQAALGVGRDAAAFMEQAKVASKDSPDGDVLVIEVDGKCPPIATEEELSKRRGKRKPKHEKECQCGCQRHRGTAKRQARGSKKRRKRGDKSKNGKEVTVVVMYTLKKGDDGKLHGPINKKVYATFAGRKAAALWARAAATRRGFGPETTNTVQIVLDGAESLKANFLTQFPEAIFTLDVCHVVERLWKLGRHFHPEGSAELTAFVEELKEFVYAGEAETLVAHLRKLHSEVSPRGPGTKGRREALAEQIGYLEKRYDMMRYSEWRKQDLVIGSGQAEGAVRQLVGERFDCSGMRWIKGKAEPVLHLRCIELNNDWEMFASWLHRRNHDRLRKVGQHRVLTDQPMTLANAA